MKFKPTDKAGGVVVELGPQERQLPPLTAEQGVGALPVFKLKKILVPVDFSACSKKALQYAIPFAKQFDSELVLLHVLQPAAPMLEMPPVDMESVEDATKELKELQGTIHDAVQSSTVLRLGTPHMEIIAAAKELHGDLIILSTHGRSGLERVLLGSTAEKIVRHASCPVLVVREHEHEFIADSGGATATG
jgi:universal stress protein A